MNTKYTDEYLSICLLHEDLGEKDVKILKLMCNLSFSNEDRTYIFNVLMNHKSLEREVKYYRSLKWKWYWFKHWFLSKNPWKKLYHKYKIIDISKDTEILDFINQH